MSNIETFSGLLEKGTDNALLRYSLANAYVTEKRHADAIQHLLKAIDFDGQYSAAWKLLGRCYLETDNKPKAVEIYEQGIRVAEANGDKQAVKEMSVFLKRAMK